MKNVQQIHMYDIVVDSPRYGKEKSYKDYIANCIARSCLTKNKNWKMTQRKQYLSLLRKEIREREITTNVTMIIVEISREIEEAIKQAL